MSAELSKHVLKNKSLKDWELFLTTWRWVSQQWWQVLTRLCLPYWFWASLLHLQEVWGKILKQIMLKWMHPLKVNISSIALLLSFRNSLNDLLNQGQAGFCWCRLLSRLTVVKLRAPNINNNFISLDKQRKLPQMKDFPQKSRIPLEMMRTEYKYTFVCWCRPGLLVNKEGSDSRRVNTILVVIMNFISF